MERHPTVTPFPAAGVFPAQEPSERRSLQMIPDPSRRSAEQRQVFPWNPALYYKFHSTSMSLSEATSFRGGW